MSFACPPRRNTRPSSWDSGRPRRLVRDRALPRVFAYAEDPTSGRTHPTGRLVYRPVVNITLSGPDDAYDATFLALVDSGAERVLAAPGVARRIGVTPDEDRPVPLKIGGETRLIHPADVTLRLAPASGGAGGEWRAEVGFFDQFTISFSRQALRLAIEHTETFDERFGRA